MMMEKTLRKWLKPLAKVVPLQNVIVFESHSDFCDNSRALFEYMMSEGLDKRYKMVWLVENPSDFRGKFGNGVKFIKVDSEDEKTMLNWAEKLVYYYYAATARFAFYSHRRPPFKLNKGEVFVNLWHGTGPKNANCDLGMNFDYVIYSSDTFKKAYVESDKCKEEQLLAMGSPRNDLLFIKSDALSKLSGGKYRKSVVWLPTYRTHMTGEEHYKADKTSQTGIPIISSQKELEELNEVLKDNDMLLVIKFHPAQNLENIKSRSHSNMLFLTNKDLSDKDVQLYSLLGEADALITDISSVYFDYLLTNKPIAFTVDDIYEYKAGYLVDNILEYMPGRHMVSFEDIKSFLAEMAISKDDYALERMRINKLVNKDTEGEFSKKIVEHFNIV
ncbi:MAG: hypothetical protein GT589_05100 [Peptoclostridium sp.]|uniref:CDP-glycerol glycerophosphotransferase family protein n=1 Tax=Peptoclostridium sp. TaxID=1904860 RepID=UPI00139B1BF0|nr:CDP-glycerol glycerophosphotransferase family protein [Peptoclostridium sp.]MZQ75520.1 hypothetical protein [Peptoclostridium sp.]